MVGSVTRSPSPIRPLASCPTLENVWDVFVELFKKYGISKARAHADARAHFIADYARPHELPSAHGKARVRNVAIARRLRRRRGGYALHAPAGPGGLSSLRRRRRRPRRRHLRPAYLRGDALLGRRSAGVE